MITDKDYPESIDELTEQEYKICKQSIESFKKNHTYKTCPENIDREALAIKYGLFRIFRYRIEKDFNNIKEYQNEDKYE